MENDLDNSLHYIKRDGDILTVFHHGLGLSKGSFLEISKALTTSVLLLDCRGHGNNTETNPDLSLGALSDDLFKILSKLSYKSYILVGHSLGASVVVDVQIKYNLKMYVTLS